MNHDEEIEKRIKKYQRRGWDFGDNPEGWYYITTPSGNVFEDYCLLNNICPVCSQVDEEVIVSLDCLGHNKEVEKEIEEATTLAQLLHRRDKIELEEVFF